MSSSILVADDILASTKKGQQRSQNLRLLASQLAKILNLKPHLLFVEDLPENLRKRHLLPSLEKRNPDMIDKLQKSLNALHPDWQVHIESGDSLGKILKGIHDFDPFVTVISTRGKKGVTKLFLGSVAEEVIRHSSAPVVVLGPHFQNAPIPLNSKRGFRILVLSDLSKASSRAEMFALNLAKKTGAQVTMMSSVGEPIMHLKNIYYRSRIPLQSMDGQIREMKEIAQLSLQRRAGAFFKQGIPIKTKLKTREIETEKDIQEELESGYDLIVMGTHGRNHMLSTFLGSTARKVCLLSPIPVLILRSDS